MRALRLVTMLSLLLTLGLLTSCGKQANEIVKDVALETTIDEAGDVWISSSALFDFGGMSMTAIQLPVVNPSNPEKLYGELAIRPTFGGTFNEVEISVNLSEAARVPGSSEPTLPNGQPLPIGGIDSVNLIELAVDSINSKIYIGLGHDITFLGYAIAIAEFDEIIKYVPGANVFLGFEFANIRGAAGLFTGSATSNTESGLGFFVDLSSVITTDILNDIITGLPSEEEKLDLVGDTNGQKALGILPMRASDIQERKLSKSKQNDLNKAIYRLSKKTKTLHVE